LRDQKNGVGKKSDKRKRQCNCTKLHKCSSTQKENRTARRAWGGCGWGGFVGVWWGCLGGWGGGGGWVGFLGLGRLRRFWEAGVGGVGWCGVSPRVICAINGTRRGDNRRKLRRNINSNPPSIKRRPKTQDCVCSASEGWRKTRLRVCPPQSRALKRGHPATQPGQRGWRKGIMRMNFFAPQTSAKNL